MMCVSNVLLVGQSQQLHVFQATPLRGGVGYTLLMSGPLADVSPCTISPCRQARKLVVPWATTDEGAVSTFSSRVLHQVRRPCWATSSWSSWAWMIFVSLPGCSLQHGWTCMSADMLSLLQTALAFFFSSSTRPTRKHQDSSDCLRPETGFRVPVSLADCSPWIFFPCICSDLCVTSESNMSFGSMRATQIPVTSQRKRLVQ